MTPAVPPTPTAIALYRAGFHGDTLTYQLEYAASTLEWKAALAYYKAGVWERAEGVTSCGCDACVQVLTQTQAAEHDSARVLDGAEVAE
jgi:hypothetical protein